MPRLASIGIDLFVKCQIVEPFSSKCQLWAVGSVRNANFDIRQLSLDPSPKKTTACRRGANFDAATDNFDDAIPTHDVEWQTFNVRCAMSFVDDSSLGYDSFDLNLDLCNDPGEIYCCISDVIGQ